MVDKVNLKFDRYKKGAVAPEGDQFAANFLDTRVYDTVQLVLYKDMERLSGIVQSGDYSKERLEGLRAVTRGRFENQRSEELKGQRRLESFELRHLEATRREAPIAYALFVDGYSIARPADDFTSHLLKERDGDDESVQFSELAAYERTIDDAIAQLEVEARKNASTGNGGLSTPLAAVAAPYKG